jgi:hypothetical protein
VNPGYEKPILVNRNTPMFGSIYFKIPWLRKIRPTAKRMNSMLRDSDGTQRMLSSSRNLKEIDDFNYRDSIISDAECLRRSETNCAAPHQVE